MPAMRRPAGGLELAAIAIKYDPHPDGIGYAAQVGGVCREFPGKYPGDCGLPDTGLFADLLLSDAAFLCDFCEARGYFFWVVHI